MPLMAGTASTTPRTIPGIPAAVDRQQLATALTGLGFDVDQLARLDVHSTGLYATTYETDASTGARILEEGQPATSRTYVRIVDAS